jgi:hypothetical protein
MCLFEKEEQKHSIKPTGCATCMAFRHRHFRLSSLIETVEMRQEDEQDEPGAQKGPVAGVQWSRKGGCLFFVRRKAPWKKSGCEIERGSRDLLNKDPQTPAQELARATGRSVSWVKKWRKRLREGDPQDQELLCSRSRAHHAPYFRWDPRVETCIVEMRLSPPEHLGRTPGPRALLYYLPRDPVLQAAGVLLPRSSRTVWKLLRKTGCLLPKPQRNLWPDSASGAVGGDSNGFQRCQ